MRNASDIFCLNEEGTDGMQMFSVNGNCPMRIRRRAQQRENECFSYSREFNEAEQALGKGDIISDKLESGEKLNASEMDAPDGSETDRGLYQNVDTQASPRGDQKNDSELQFHKLNEPSGSNQVTTSTIMRNPLTGAGMEIKEHRKPKKGRNSNGKWVW